MAELNYSTTISIDLENSVFNFYSMVDDSIEHFVKGFPNGPLNDEFFEKFKLSVKTYAEKKPSEKIQKITVVLPDSAVLTDLVKIPTMKDRSQTKKMLDIALNGLYRNYEDLHITNYLAYSNKQYSTFAVSAVQKKIAAAIYSACSENKMLVETLTNTSSATIGGAVLINPKLKNKTYLFLDIKEVTSRFIFVVNGKAVGSYTLPFGLEFLNKSKVVQEDMLFDHSFAELAVLNARERAKAKKLTVMSVDSETGESDEDFDAEKPNTEIFPGLEGTFPTEAVAAEIPSDLKLFTRKAPRKLPKFMQREIPETEEDILYENFRIFVKWALTLIQENEKLTEIGKPEFVCVNMPRNMVTVLDRVNEEESENGIEFTYLPFNVTGRPIRYNLELYGGLSPKQINSAGKF
ncbi:MAG: hypothetical protein IJD95_00260 [Clostridia bacterium]|nr:hypothetical protein [Clostridia bacterium]